MLTVTDFVVGSLFVAATTLSVLWDVSGFLLMNRLMFFHVSSAATRMPKKISLFVSLRLEDKQFRSLGTIFCLLKKAGTEQM